MLCVCESYLAAFFMQLSDGQAKEEEEEGQQHSQLTVSQCQWSWSSGAEKTQLKASPPFWSFRKDATTRTARSVSWTMATQSQQQQQCQLASHSYIATAAWNHWHIPRWRLGSRKPTVIPALATSIFLVPQPFPFPLVILSPTMSPLACLAGLASFVLSSIEIRFLLCFLHCHLQREHQHIRLLHILFGIYIPPSRREKNVVNRLTIVLSKIVVHFSQFSCSN